MSKSNSRLNKVYDSMIGSIMYKSFEDWYTDTFGGRITKEQASDAERIAYDYYVDNCFLTEEDVKNQKAKEEVKMTETIRTDNSETLKNALLRIKALEEQIEKMKCCPNCKSWDSQNLNFCEKGKRMCGYRACEEWEMKE